MGIFVNLFKKKKKAGAPELNLLTAETPFAIRQAYKSLYTNVLYLNIESECKKIAVTSPLPGECKSTVSANLALMLAENLEDKRVLLIDSDMRSPKVWKLFDLPRNGKGLSEYLAGIDELPNIQRYGSTRLSILTTGGQSVNPTKLAGSQNMRKLMEYCAERFDYVVIDTPPVNVVSDALLLGSFIDGYIISSRSDSSDINSISDCVDNINKTGKDIFGIVLSDVKLKSTNKKYGSNYSRYQAYEKEIVSQ